MLTTTSSPYEEVKPIFQKHCTQCHNTNWPDKDWTNYDIIFKNKDKIKLRLSNNTMPPGNFTKMTKEERNLLIKWIDDGANR